MEDEISTEDSHNQSASVCQQVIRVHNCQGDYDGFSVQQTRSSTVYLTENSARQCSNSYMSARLLTGPRADTTGRTSRILLVMLVSYYKER